MSVRVSAGARLHFGFVNLSLSHDRLYGSVGISLAEPRVTVEARPSEDIVADPDLHSTVERVVEVLDVPGANVEISDQYRRHVGLGGGTQRVLAILAAVARTYDEDPAVRSHAPALGRGGRSGVGVASFERGGFVLDDGHPVERFTTEPPETGDWTVPRVAARHEIPQDWRFLLVVPAGSGGRHGTDEEASMRATVERADPTLGDRIAGLVLRRVLPAVTATDVSAFGAAVADLGRLNGRWYAAEQGGLYRPPVGEIVESLSRSPAIEGAGQSSWGPTVYGITDEAHANEAERAGHEALDAAGLDGTVSIVRGRNVGATIEEA